MRVLVTGSQGYIGTVLCAQFIAAGHEVVGLDTGYFSNCVLGSDPSDPPTLDRDIRDVDAADLEGFDAVVHLAALSNDPLGELVPRVTYDINLDGSLRVARAAKAAGVSRFLYASTCSVYGNAGNGLVDETADLAPLTPYAKSKVEVETQLTALADADFSPTYLRNATAFGLSARLRADIVLNNLVAHAIFTGSIQVLSDGTPWRPLVHVRDIAAAFLAAVQSPLGALHCVALNIGDESNNVTVADIANAVADAIPDATVAITGSTGADPRSYRVDFSRARQLLPAFKPSWSVRDGAVELRDAYLESDLDGSEFFGRFTRLRHLESLQESGQLDERMRWISDGSGRP